MTRLLAFFVFAICLQGNAFADQKGVREVRPWIEGRWAVVDVKADTGQVVVVSGAVGQEIDQIERNQFAVFEGETTFNRDMKIPVLKTPIVGFQKAVFLKFDEDRYGLLVTFRNEMGLQDRLLPIKNRDVLIEMRDYFENVAEESDQTYTYPMETETQIAFETVQPRFRAGSRLMGQLVLSNGEKVKGELLPVTEAGQMMVETKQGFRRVDISAIQQVGIGGRGAAGILEKTLRGSLYWGFTGGMTGLMSGFFYEGVSAREQMIYGLVIGSTVGGMIGLLDGVLSIQPGKTFHLGSMDRNQHSKYQLEVSPTMLKLRF